MCHGNIAGFFEAQKSTVLILALLDHLVDLWYHCPAKIRVEKGFGEICDIIGDAFAEKEGSEIVGEVVAIMGPKVVCLVIVSLVLKS